MYISYEVGLREDSEVSKRCCLNFDNVKGEKESKIAVDMLKRSGKKKKIVTAYFVCTLARRAYINKVD